MPNPINIIKEDHRTVEKLFTQLRGVSGSDKKRDVANKIIKALAVHAKMEERYFYPELRKLLGEKNPKPVADAEAEHHMAKVLLLELKVLSVDSDTFDSKMKVLEDNIMHHVEEEESQLLPFAEEQISVVELETMGKEMETYRENANKSLLEKILGE